MFELGCTFAWLNDVYFIHPETGFMGDSGDIFHFP